MKEKTKIIVPVKYHKCYLCQKRIPLGKDIEGCCSEEHAKEYHEKDYVKAHMLRTGRIK